MLGVNIQDTQLSGSLLANLAGWKEVLSGYYLWTLLGLMLPFSLMLPFLIRRLWKDRQPMNGTVRLLLCACLSLLVVFTLGGHYRKHYMLPLLPLLSLMLANAVGAGTHVDLSVRLKRGFTIAFTVTAGLCAWLILRERAYLSLAWILLNAVPIWMLIRSELKHEGWAEKPLASRMVKASAAVAILTTGILAFLPMAVVRWRRSEQGFAESVGKTLHPNDLIVQWRINEPILPFYARRPVLRFNEVDKLKTFYLENKPEHTLYAVIPRTESVLFSKSFDGQVLLNVKRDRHPEDDLEFIELVGVRY
jgi:4-amino-4-deoxy-L-arabinose transferase-like glycosyltransferase